MKVKELIALLSKEKKLAQIKISVRKIGDKVGCKELCDPAYELSHTKEKKNTAVIIDVIQ